MSEQSQRGRRSRPAETRRSGTSARIGAVRAAPTGGGAQQADGPGSEVRGNLAFPILALFLVMAGVVASVTTVRLHDRSADSGGVSPFAPATHAVVIVIDGADPAQLERAAMPNIKALRDNGITYSRAWIGQEETTAAASAAGIGTGSFPRRNGVVGDVWFDARAGHVVRPTLPETVQVGGIDTVMEPTGVGSLASAVKADRSSARVLSVGGTNCAAAAALGTWVADYVVCAQRRQGTWGPVSVAGHELPAGATAASGVRTRAARRGPLAAQLQGWNPTAQDHWIAREAVAAMKSTRPTLTFVSFPEIGIARQNLTPARAASVMPVMLRGLDADVGRLVQETRREAVYKSTIFVITSGRAFEPIHTRMSYARLANAIVAAGGQATYLTGDASALIGLRDPLQAQPVAQALQAENTRSIDAVYFKSQAGSTWSYNAQYLGPSLSSGFARATAYLLSTVASAGAPDVVVVYRPYAALAAPGRQAGALGLQWNMQHVPLIVAGHGVYAGRTSSYPARLVDIAPTLETALGLPVGSQDGVVLHDALFGATAGADVQASQRKRLGPLIAALQGRIQTAPR